MNTEIIAYISAFIALVSAISAISSNRIAQNAVKTAEKTHTAQIIAQIYEKYHSPSIRKDFQKVWELYGQAWHSSCNDDTEASIYANKGEPISMEMAREVLRKYDKQSPEYIAIDNVNGLWAFMMMLIFQEIVDIDELSTIATARILGFLYPIDEAKASLYGYTTHPKVSLKNLYETWKTEHPNSF